MSHKSRRTGRALLDAGDHPECSGPFVVSVNGDFAHPHPDILKRLLEVDAAIARWADASPDETVSTFGAERKSSEASVRKTYTDRAVHQDPQITDEALAALKNEGKFMAEAKLPKGSVDYGPLRIRDCSRV